MAQKGNPALIGDCFAHCAGRQPHPTPSHWLPLPRFQVRFLSTNKHLHRLGNSSTVLWAELLQCLGSPREAQLFGTWLRPKAQLLQRLGVCFETYFPQGAETEARQRWEEAQHDLLSCIAGSTSLHSLQLVCDRGTLAVDMWCAALPNLR